MRLRPRHHQEFFPLEVSSQIYAPVDIPDRIDDQYLGRRIRAAPALPELREK